MNNKAFQSHYIPNTPNDQRSMLNTMGLASVEELFSDIPEQFRNPTLNIPSPISEIELRKHFDHLGSQNINVCDFSNFLGAGSYNHFVPSIVKSIISRGEFLTSYTPYQAEASQGTLQAGFEFQTAICNLMGMEVSNDGMYDGATSLTEAALMACRITGKSKICLASSISPTYREVINTYAIPQGLEVITIDLLNPSIPVDAACILIQYPNFFGYIDDLSYAKTLANDSGALLVVSTDPIAMGMFKPPGDYGADIVTGEGQGLGIPLSFGGPYVGLFSTRSKYVRQMPGRLVGRTVDLNGETGYVLTLQTREQHIRREKATSNICTSQALLSLASTIFLAALGKQGLKQMAEISYHKSHYAASRIENMNKFSLPIKGNFFKEFVVECPTDPQIINARLLEKGIIGGLDLSHIMPNCMLLCFTEMNSLQDIDDLLQTLLEFSK